MTYRLIRRANVALSRGLILVMTLTGCETAQPDETPSLIMEQTDDTAVAPGQSAPSESSEPSAPSGASTPR